MSDAWQTATDVYDWVMDNVMPILEDIIDTIGPIVAVVALFVPALAPLALGLAIAPVAIDGLQALRGEDGAAEEFFMGLAGLALGGALGKVGKALDDGTRQVLVPTISGGGGALAAAGGGPAAAGSRTMGIRFSPQALQANTMWMATKMTEAQMSGNDLAGALAQPAVNLVERGRNLIQCQGCGLLGVAVELVATGREPVSAGCRACTTRSPSPRRPEASPHPSPSPRCSSPCASASSAESSASRTATPRAIPGRSRAARVADPTRG